LSICFASGIFAGKTFNINWKYALAVCLTSALLTIILLARKLGIAFLAIAFTALGAFYFQSGLAAASPDRLKVAYESGQIRSGDPVEVEGSLRGKPEPAINGCFLEMKADRVFYKDERKGVSGNVRFFAPLRSDEIIGEYERLELVYGSRVRVASNLRRDDAFLNPGVTSRKDLLDQQEIDVSGIIESPLLIEKIGDDRGFPPLAWVYEQRQNLVREFRDKFSVSTAGIMIASLLGDKYFLDRQTADIFREGGTFHVLVISGLHITFIGGFVVVALRLVTRRKLWQFIAANVILWSYALAVGAQVPVVRAAIMFTILLLAQLIYRNGTLLNSLGACAMILLVWRPADLFTASFQLTFMSVGAIVACAFPLIENLRRIGRWSPNTAAPFPARVPGWLKRFCEMLYWREEVWKIERKRNVWSANLFKSPYFKWIEVRGLKGLAGWLFEGVLVSVIVQIWLLPLLVVYFNRVSFASVLLNLWVGFFIGLESFSAVIAVLFAQVNSALALPVIKLTEILNCLLLSVPRIFVANDWASSRPALYSGVPRAIYVLYFIPVILITIAVNKWNPFSYRTRQQGESRARKVLPVISKASAAALLLLVLLIVFHPFSAPRPDGKLHFDFLDVGQGDSTLVTFPDGQTLLIDGGGIAAIKQAVPRDGEVDEIFEPDTGRVGETVVSPFLWQRGYSKINYILATHADTDHMQGLVDAAKNFGVRSALVARTPTDDADFSELAAVLQKRGVPVVQISRGDVIVFDDVRIEVLYPEALRPDAPADARWDNNHSIVLRVTYGETKFLLTGDIEAGAERALLGDPASLKADVVKVPHHGSHTSSTQEFVNAVGAKYAVVPVGQRSRFGHPHKEVVERWSNSGAKVMTTGERGTISITTDGHDLEIKAYTGDLLP
jgi:competence protein ComEC